jgi:archaetidylinositol phosphate synthase
MSVTTIVVETNIERGAAAERRVHGSLTAGVERRALVWMAERAPRWVTSDGLTALGLAGQCGAGVCFALARLGRGALVGVMACVAMNWLGDSLDGTLARVRRQERPRYGFYVDHVVDVFGAVALMGGLALSGLVHGGVAAAMLVGFLVLASESYLATHALGRFEMSQGWFGPTEIRLLLMAGTAAAMRSPWVTVVGHLWLLFDVGGVVGAVGMFAMAVWVAARHTAELYRQERVR